MINDANKLYDATLKHIENSTDYFKKYELGYQICSYKSFLIVLCFYVDKCYPGWKINKITFPKFQTLRSNTDFYIELVYMGVIYTKGIKVIRNEIFNDILLEILPE